MNNHKDCHKLLAEISEYVDGTLRDELCADLERHLCDCENCRIVVDTLKKTIELYQQTPEVAAPLPDEVRERLFARLSLDDYLGK
jgi:anti-sigma factor RsiW